MSKDTGINQCFSKPGNNHSFCAHIKTHAKTIGFYSHYPADPAFSEVVFEVTYGTTPEDGIVECGMYPECRQLLKYLRKQDFSVIDYP